MDLASIQFWHVLLDVVISFSYIALLQQQTPAHLVIVLCDFIVLKQLMFGFWCFTLNYILNLRKNHQLFVYHSPHLFFAKETIHLGFSFWCFAIHYLNSLFELPSLTMVGILKKNFLSDTRQIMTHSIMTKR